MIFMQLFIEVLIVAFGLTIELFIGPFVLMVTDTELCRCYDFRA